MLGSKTKFTQDDNILQNVFISKHFLLLCGFTSQQLKLIPDSRTTNIGLYFNLTAIIEIVGDNQYCELISPPSRERTKPKS